MTVIDFNEQTDEQKHRDVLEHIADMEAGRFGEFFAPEGGPSHVNEVRAQTIADDYLSERGWHLPEEWAADLEEFIHENREAYDLTWWDEVVENPCSECGEEIEEDVHAGYGMCASCLHNAIRSGWDPNERSQA